MRALAREAEAAHTARAREIVELQGRLSDVALTSQRGEAAEAEKVGTLRRELEREHARALAQALAQAKVRSLCPGLWFRLLLTFGF